MEWWNNGILGIKTDDGQILISDSCHYHKNRPYSAKPIIPTLQYSIIPLCRVTAQSIFAYLAQRTRILVLD